jgi:hypothetical protein
MNYSQEKLIKGCEEYKEESPERVQIQVKSQLHSCPLGNTDA